MSLLRGRISQVNQREFTMGSTHRDMPHVGIYGNSLCSGIFKMKQTSNDTLK
jgi:hypothetical protein